ncbi:uncharacterized protein [Amphiura filiformis]|uniref:uncharacterized protein n=1 Tax=Amphiura filiformis TaxID=82378 RepID=UPI003B225648
MSLQIQYESHGFAGTVICPILPVAYSIQAPLTLQTVIVAWKQLQWMRTRCNLLHHLLLPRLHITETKLKDTHRRKKTKQVKGKTQKKTTKSKNLSRPLKTLVVNFQSIRGKTAELAVCLEVNDPDLVIGTETWIDSNVESSELFPSNYQVIRKDRTVYSDGKVYGGVLIAIKNDIIALHRVDLDTECEIVWAQIEIIGAKSIIVGAYYRPPKSDMAYFRQLRESLNKIKKSQHSNIWLAGDLNLGDIDWPTQTIKPGCPKVALSKELIDLANDFGLEQMVNKPTRKGRILDLFLTTNPTLVVKAVNLPGMSDHDGIPSITIDMVAKKSKKCPRKVYLYHRANSEDLMTDARKISEDFESKDLDRAEVNDLWNEFKDRVESSVEKNVPTLKDPSTGFLVTDSAKQAELLGRQFQSQFTKENLEDFPVEPDSGIPSMADMVIHEEGVIKLLLELNPNKAMGPDQISPKYLKLVANEIGSALRIIFQLSYDTGVVPTDWLLSNITPIFKKGDRTQTGNYRSVNLTSVCSKIFEHILKSNVMQHLDTYNILCENQHGFRRNHSCETQLINTIQDIALQLDQKQQVDMIIMDFAKAFDKVPHQRLLLKMSRYGIRGKTLKWTEAFLTQRKQRVVIEGKSSEWIKVESSVPKGTVTGPMDFCYT